MRHTAIKQPHRLTPQWPRGHAENSWGPWVNYKIVYLNEVPGFMEMSKKWHLEVLFWGRLSLFCPGSMFYSSPSRSGVREWGVRGTRVCVLSPPISCKSQLNTPTPLSTIPFLRVVLGILIEPAFLRIHRIGQHGDSGLSVWHYGVWRIAASLKPAWATLPLKNQTKTNPQIHRFVTNRANQQNGPFQNVFLLRRKGKKAFLSQ